MTLADVTNAVGCEQRRKRGSRGESMGWSGPPPIEFVCPLAGRVMRDPVMVSSGQTFERSAIEDWLGQFETPRCPVSGAVLKSEPVPNLSLRKAIQSWASTRRPAVDDASEMSFGEQGDEEEDLRPWAEKQLSQLEKDAFVPLKIVPRDISERSRRALVRAGLKKVLLRGIGRSDTLDVVRGAQLFALFHALPPEDEVEQWEAELWRLTDLEAACLAACVGRRGDEALATILALARLRALDEANGVALAGAGMAERLLDVVAEPRDLDEFTVDLAVAELHALADEDPFPRCARVAAVLMDYCDRGARDVDDEADPEKDARKNQAKVLHTLHLSIDGPHDVLALVEDDDRVVRYVVDALRSSLESDDRVQSEIGDAAFRLVTSMCEVESAEVASAVVNALVEADGVEAVWARLVALRRSAKDNKKLGEWDAWTTTKHKVNDAYRLLRELFSTFEAGSFEQNVRSLAENDDFVVVEDARDDQEDAADKIAQVLLGADLEPLVVAAAAAAVESYLDDDNATQNAKRRYASKLAEDGAFDALGGLLESCFAPAARILVALLDAADVCDHRAARAVVAINAHDKALQVLGESCQEDDVVASLALLRALTDLDEFDEPADTVKLKTVVPVIAGSVHPDALATLIQAPATAAEACLLVSNLARARRSDGHFIVEQTPVLEALVGLVLRANDDHIAAVAVDAIADVAFHVHFDHVEADLVDAVPALVQRAAIEVKLPTTNHLRPALTALASLVVFHRCAPDLRSAYAALPDVFHDFLHNNDDDHPPLLRHGRAAPALLYATAIGVLHDLIDLEPNAVKTANKAGVLVTPQGTGIARHMLTVGA